MIFLESAVLTCRRNGHRHHDAVALFGGHILRWAGMISASVNCQAPWAGKSFRVVQLWMDDANVSFAKSGGLCTEAENDSTTHP